MEPVVERKAKELAKALAESEMYAALQKARQDVETHSAAQIMMRDLQERQKRLQQKSEQGQEISEDEIAEFQRMSQVAAMNPYVRQLVDAQMSLAQTMMQIQQMLAAAVGLELDEPEDGEEETTVSEPQSKEESSPRSRLWVPGSN